MNPKRKTLNGQQLLKDFEDIRTGWPERKLPISAVRVSDISRTGRATGIEWRLLCQYLGVYLFEFEIRYNKEIHAE